MKRSILLIWTDNSLRLGQCFPAFLQSSKPLKIFFIPRKMFTGQERLIVGSAIHLLEIFVKKIYFYRVDVSLHSEKKIQAFFLYCEGYLEFFAVYQNSQMFTYISHDFSQNS